jgi:hypothetical protein
MYETEILLFVISLLGLLELTGVVILVVGKTITELIKIARKTKAAIQKALAEENE